MNPLSKPPALKKGDTVATVNLSWGGAGDEDILWRYRVGKQRLEEQFGLKVMEMPHTLRGTAWVHDHPEQRAEDLMAAFADPAVRGILSCIGGDDSVRLLPFVDTAVLARNPKVFLGFSDTTVTHFLCRKAGISSFYGPSVLAGFAENGGMFDYSAYWVKKALFSADPMGEILPAPFWTSEHLPWEEKNREIRRKTTGNPGYEVLQGRGKVRGRLLGGCAEVLEMLKGTAVWPEPEEWEDTLFFLETSEDMPEPKWLRYWLRNYGAAGILSRVKGMLFGRPYDDRYGGEYRQVIRSVLREFGLEELPVLFNVSIGHTEPVTVLPMGALAEIDCEKPGLAILEPGVE